VNRKLRLKAMTVAATVVLMGVVSVAPASGAAGDTGSSGANAGCVGWLSSIGFNASNFGGGEQVAILAPQKLAGFC
jgi:hypothetical protein